MHRRHDLEQQAIEVSRVGHGKKDAAILGRRVLLKGEPQRFILGHQHKVRSRKHRPYRNNRSGVHGVWWSGHDQKWVAQLQVNGRRICLGYHHTIDAAESAVTDYLRREHAAQG